MSSGKPRLSVSFQPLSVRTPAAKSVLFSSSPESPSSGGSFFVHPDSRIAAAAEMRRSCRFLNFIYIYMDANIRKVFFLPLGESVLRFEKNSISFMLSTMSRTWILWMKLSGRLDRRG